MKNDFGVEEIPEASEPSEADIKKRRFEPVEPVEWFQRKMRVIAWQTNTLHERVIHEIDVVDPLEHEIFCVEIQRCGCERICRMVR